MAVDSFRATRQFERFLGYRGQDTLYTAPLGREVPRAEPHYKTIGELLLSREEKENNGEVDLIARIDYFPEQKRIRTMSPEYEAKITLGHLGRVLNQIAFQKSREPAPNIS